MKPAGSMTDRISLGMTEGNADSVWPLTQNRTEYFGSG